MTRTLALVALLLTLPVLAETRSYSIAADGKNHASFESVATLENIKGTATKISGTITADPANPAASSVDLTIDVASLDTGVAMRNEHLRDRYLAAEKFPTMSFKSISVTAPVRAIGANQPVDVSVTGDMTLHGVTKRITVPVRVVVIPESELTRTSRGAGDWIHATTTFPIKLTDFGIEVPEKLLMKVSNDISIKVDVFAGSKQ
jgi:polyisoprenoid-binding protein YceI